MASAFPIQLVDDDEEIGFDWDAAVREIDVACEATSSSAPSTRNISHNAQPYRGIADTLVSGKDCKSRQSTLDKFISREGPRKPLEEVHINQSEFSGAGERDFHVKIDREAAKTWIYPVNVPHRDYQFSITKTALFSNTLVALPTGLGKTLIAAVVMYNYFRWFPEGKIVFAAPSRPLVMQQIEACHNVVGIPQECTIDMTGQTTPLRRAEHWKEKRVFFVTPQVLEKDIQSGICAVKFIVCLVIDEAHRAMGNFAYCVAVRELMDVPVQLRILALSATPGSKQRSIQQVIDNLNISTLEYRNENDQDVCSYVHNRKIELIEVAMGKDVADIDVLLLSVIRPYIARLCALQVLHNRDITAWSSFKLLDRRETFRKAPPQNVSHVKYGEVEGYFGVLITLYHIRKLLSIHGVKPAYDMLEEKLQKGPFARIMGRNEVIHQIKLLMQRSLSHEAPSPKLVKLLEVLTDHFNSKDPLSSRVIIFSNFRGSVSDIMSKLETIGEHVKPTEFIGQSSGKSRKGQSQKLQQAVLKKFRAGEYNVIVATSIGEEGLDIMEVDLVICFDANVSPLRMIQRMGRTGRKQDGRLLVLACEGSEVKGYKQKLGTCISMKKHLHNGGITSFNFHPSPRMVPHVLSPEVQFVELSIEQFVHRNKTMKEDPSMQSHKRVDKLLDFEIHLLAKYFLTVGDCTMKPSLIAFPSCQSFPSRMHKVKHSFRTGILIDMMQQLQGISYTGNSRIISVEDEASPFLCSGGGVISIDQSGKDKKNHVHFHLFSSEFASVDPLGRVSIMSAPILPYRGEVNSLPPQPETQLMKSISTDEDCDAEASDIVGRRLSILGDYTIKRDQTDAQLSPRLTNFILKGVVPESPDCGKENGEEDINSLVPEFISPTKPSNGFLLKTSCSEKCEVVCANNGCTTQNSACAAKGIHTPGVNIKTRGIPNASPNIPEEIHAPSIDLTSDYCRKEWHLNSGNKTATVEKEKPRKLKRLRRYRDLSINNMEHKSIVDVDPSVSSPRYPHSTDTENKIDEVIAFIDEEAGVSSSSDVAGYEEDEEEGDSSYDDSFIDDKISLSEDTQAEASKVDMMSVYRRSLLSQSPLVGQPEYFNNTGLMTNTTENGNSANRPAKSNSIQLSRYGMHSITTCLDSNQQNPKGILSSANLCSSSRPSEIDHWRRSQKRKLSSCRAKIIAPINLDKQFARSDAEGTESFLTGEGDKTEPHGDVFGDDDFFAGLDLDAVEAQATLFLKSKAEKQTHKQSTYNDPGSPTFDLGI
uniref:Uncharacterized protein n=1 Tax=Kalanchoe fedtschenkoi TaxID=63787 RepID=A0A7N0TMJ9_KALFE